MFCSSFSVELLIAEFGVFVCFSEVDSDGDEVADEDEETKEFYGYRIWYSFEVFVKPPQPERVIPVTCACQVNINNFIEI